jgi:serine/threonine protein kinase
VKDVVTGERGPFHGATLGGRYRIEGLIARGGMADVHRAHDEVLDRAVAVKVFRPGTAEPERFRNETLLLAQLEHPHLVSLYDGGDHEGAPFLVMELCQEATLADRMAGGALPSADVATLGVGVADALAAVHERGIVHRDVKPSNILLAVDGRAVLADFGVARIIDSTRLTAITDTVGTGAYLAPTSTPSGWCSSRRSPAVVPSTAWARRPSSPGSPAARTCRRAWARSGAASSPT